MFPIATATEGLGNCIPIEPQYWTALLQLSVGLQVVVIQKLPEIKAVPAGQLSEEFDAHTPDWQGDLWDVSNGGLYGHF